MDNYLMKLKSIMVYSLQIKKSATAFQAKRYVMLTI